MRPIIIALLITGGMALATTGGLAQEAEAPCTPAESFAGIVLETGCLEEVLDICDAYLNDEMHRLPEHQQDAICEY